jgi:hypothetical protein
MRRVRPAGVRRRARPRAARGTSTGPASSFRVRDRHRFSLRKTARRNGVSPVQLDVSHRGHRIRIVHWTRVEPPLPQVPAPAMEPVDVLRIDKMRPPNRWLSLFTPFSLVYEATDVPPASAGGPKGNRSPKRASAWLLEETSAPAPPHRLHIAAVGGSSPSGEAR